MAKVSVGSESWLDASERNPRIARSASQRAVAVSLIKFEAESIGISIGDIQCETHRDGHIDLSPSIDLEV